MFNKFAQYDVNNASMSSEFAYPIFQISTGERGRAENKHPVRNEEFIQLRLGLEFEGEEKVFPGHETTTSPARLFERGKTWAHYRHCDLSRK